MIIIKKGKINTEDLDLLGIGNKWWAVNLDLWGIGNKLWVVNLDLSKPEYGLEKATIVGTELISNGSIKAFNVEFDNGAVQIILNSGYRWYAFFPKLAYYKMVKRAKITQLRAIPSLWSDFQLVIDYYLNKLPLSSMKYDLERWLLQ